MQSSFEEYLAKGGDTPEEQAIQESIRKDRLSRFPHAIMLLVSFPELDFANRWCWQHFGPADGDCTQPISEYRVCDRSKPHSHTGKWTSHWFEKTDYNFGFNEWYFVHKEDAELFLRNVPEINWGENYPK